VGGLCTFPVGVVVDQVVTIELMRAVAAGDGVHGERLPLSAQDYRGSRHGGISPPWGGVRGRARPRVRVSAVECIDLASGCCELETDQGRSAGARIRCAWRLVVLIWRGVSRLGTARAARAFQG
jgi:hypothetical protein